MIIWSGLGNDGKYYYRCLGTNNTTGTFLHRATYDNAKIASCFVLRHNECTTRHDGTSPTIGHGDAKQSRDYCIQGYSLGCTPTDEQRKPVLFDYASEHVVCYDIEAEFTTKSACNLRAPIMCCSLVCSCGWRLFITRCRIADSSINQVLVSSNSELAILVVRNIIRHAPTFTIGHNIYAFDNVVLSFALPKYHPYARLFKAVTKVSITSYPSMGLMMAIPGINNLDTLMYIRTSMFGTFNQFSLDSLGKQLKLCKLKMNNKEMPFNIALYTSCADYARRMARYNIMDCEVTIELCKKLDLVNQIVALCYCSRAWAEDVMLYNTGAMATSCTCYNALKEGYRYNWTRCDWKPMDFRGGEILFSTPLIASNVQIVDFNAMYPSIIASVGVSPESIDIECSMFGLQPRFTHITAHVCTMTTIDGTFIGVCVVGTDEPDECTGDPSMECTLCEWHDMLHTEPTDAYIKQMLDLSVFKSDPTLRECTTLIRCYSHAGTYKRGLGHCRSSQLCAASISLHGSRNAGLSSPYETRESLWYWPESSHRYNSYAVDWVQCTLGHATIVSGPDFQARFFPGRSICAEACKSLIAARKEFKQLLKAEESKANPDPYAMKVYDQVQYAYKINANSLYGILSFTMYNTYSPRCGMSITACGRWALNATACIISALGFDILYGDTDSVMFALAGNVSIVDAFTPSSRDRPIQDTVDAMTLLHPGISTHHLSEYLAGSPGSDALCNQHMHNIRGLVPRIVNRVMSFTCLVDLKIETQDTKVTVDGSIKSRVYKSFVLLAKKHYSAALHDGTHMTKGIAYVRRSGAVLTNMAYKRFIHVLQTSTSLTEMQTRLQDEYRLLRHKVCYNQTRNARYMVIKTTVVGVTDEYVSVIMRGQTKPVQVLKASYNPKFMVYNTKYYTTLLDKCMQSVLKALDIDDVASVTSSSLYGACWGYARK